MFAAINFLENAHTLKDVAAVPMYHLHNLKGDKQHLYAIDLGRKLGYRIVFEPDPPICDADNSLDFLSKCTKIKNIIIMGVSNHYD